MDQNCKKREKWRKQLQNSPNLDCTNGMENLPIDFIKNWQLLATERFEIKKCLKRRVINFNLTGWRIDISIGCGNRECSSTGDSEDTGSYYELINSNQFTQNKHAPDIVLSNKFEKLQKFSRYSRNSENKKIGRIWINLYFLWIYTLKFDSERTKEGGKMTITKRNDWMCWHGTIPRLKLAFPFVTDTEYMELLDCSQKCF